VGRDHGNIDLLVEEVAAQEDDLLLLSRLWREGSTPGKDIWYFVIFKLTSAVTVS